MYNTSTQGDRLGYIYHGDTNNGTTTSLTISGDYEYIALRSVSGAMYLTNITIVWETGGSTTTYDVTCNSATNGSISVGSITSYAEGATVTVTATPTDGYKLSTVTVTPETGTAFQATVSGKTATFTMPASNVEVDATFTEKVSTTYKLVKSTTDLVAGAEYMIAGLNTNNAYVALMGAISGNLGTAVQSDFSYDSETEILTVEDGCTATPITLGGNTGEWTFHNGAGYICHTGDKKIDVSSTVGTYEKWIINTNNFPYNRNLIQNAGNTVYYLQYNSGAPRFTDYNSSQQAVALFKKVETGAYTINKVCDPTAGGSISCSKGSSNGNEEITFSVSTNDNYEFAYVEVKNASNNAVEFTEDTNNPGTYSFTMPTSDVTITAHFNQAGTLYILGEANGKFDNADWQPNVGTLMTYSNGKYTARAYFKGYTKNNDGYSKFAFSKKLAENTAANGGWDEINWDGSRYGSGADGDYWGIGGGTNESSFNTTIPLYNGSQKSYRVPAGVYDIEVDLKANPNTVKVTPVDLSVTLDPASGTFAKGKEIAISSNLTSIVAATGSNETVLIQHKVGDGEYVDGSTAILNTVGENIAVIGKASIGHIVVADTSTYTIENKYTVTVASGITNGTVKVNGANEALVEPGDDVTITATPNNGYSLANLTVTDANNNPIAVTDGKFTMPESNVTVSATFAVKSYGITVVNTNCSVDVATTANYNSQVTFTVTPRSDKYEVSTVTVTYGENSSKPVTDNGDGTYSFYMPAADVTITVICTRKAVGDGSFVLVTDATTLTAGDKVIITNSGTAGSALAMGADKGNNRGVSSVTITEDLKITPSAVLPTEGGVQVLTLESTSLTGYSPVWLFNAGTDGYLYAASSGSNYLKTDNLTTAGNNAKATITIEGNDKHAVITFRGGNTRNIIRKNSNSDLFSCYGSGQSPVYLFKQTAADLAVEISPEGGTFLNSEHPNGVTVTISCSNDDADIYYTTDGTEPSASNGTPIESGNTITVTTTTTVQAIAILGDEASEVVSETYNFTDVLIDPVVFSPIPGSYSGAQTLEMYSVNQNAKIYYTTDGSTPSATNGTLYGGEIPMAVGNTYNFKAIAVLGNNCSEITEGTYVINAASSSGLNSIAELNIADTDEEATLGNPFQIIYMNTWRNDGHTPEYAYVRDNTGYGLIYFRNDYYHYTSNGVVHDNPNAVQNALICEMGDWIPGNAVTGTVKIWSDGFHNELGGSSYRETITAWPTSTNQLAGNTPIIPEEMTNANINAGWDVSNTFADAFNAAFQQYCTNNNLDPENLTDQQKNNANAYAIEQVGGYSSHIQPNNVWGHYVHLRKNTIEVTNGKNAANATPDGEGELKRHKYSGFVTDQSGEKTIYYDGFYLFSGYNGTVDLSNDYFEEIQNAGATFDVYGIVGFYGPYAADADHNYIPFEIIPIDFKYIYKPIINIDNVAYSDHEPITALGTKTVTLTCATEGATIWYKTSDMEDYEEYIPGTTEIIVDNTTTIETYSSIGVPEYNDMMESVVNSLTINMGDIKAPVISPASEVFTTDHDPVNATISCETTDATIYFTVDGSDPKDEENANRYEYTTANITEYLTGIHETTTVRAIAYKEVEGTGYYSAEAEARTYTFVKSNGIKYNLVTDQTQLNESSVYVIVNKANNMAVGTTQEATNRSADGVMFVDDTKTQVYGNDELAQFTLKKVGNKWYMQTLNGSVTGYLYVGDGNTLLTGAATDAAEATINIDADAEHQAHISFVYNNETTRYLRYWNGGQAFSTYTSETSNLPVSLYSTVATPLANIEKEGVVGNQYTIADELIAVHYVDAQNAAGEFYLWCKDQGNVSISKTEKTSDDQIDYLKDVTKVQNGDWDQSNWVVLKFTNPQDETTISGAVGKFIKPATITGHYTDDVNFTITIPNGEDLNGLVGEDANFTPNVYCPVNFLDDNLNINGGEGPVGAETGEHYFFMNPKVQEVATVTYAVWNGSCFVVPAKAGGNNQGDFDGAFTVGWTYNSYGNQQSELQDSTVYRFLAVLNTVDSNTGTGAKANEAGTVAGQDSNPQAGKMVYALNLQGGSESSNIITAIKDVIDVTGKTVASVKYYNLAGIESDRPFDGVNIIVTTYTDGSRSSAKVLK